MFIEVSLYIYRIPDAYPRFNVLKAWIANPDLSNVEVEEKYTTFAQQKRKDQYVTV